MKRFLLIIALVILGLNLNAQSTIIDYDGYSLKFTVTNESPAECSVSCVTPQTVETELTIPSSVTIEGTSYNVTIIEDYAFQGCTKFVGNLVIPNSVKEIGDKAFENCSGFDGTLTLSENLESIGYMGFANCNFIEKLTIPNSLKYIGEDGFSRCGFFTSLEFEEDSQLTTIDVNAFLGCGRLSGELNIPGSVTNIGMAAFFFCESITSVNLSNGVDTIGMAVFAGCMNLKNVYIPNSVTSIGNSAFLSCESLESVIFEDNIQIDTICICFASDCINLKNIKIPESVKIIDSEAFGGCSSLENIEIPSGVTAINAGVFRQCTSLSSIICNPESVPTTSSDVFEGCPSDMNVYVPEASVEAYKAISPWSNYTILPMSVSVVSFDSDDESAFNVYPNPTSANAPINLGATFDRVEVYNAAGAKVAEYRETDNISGIETSGVYFIKAVIDDKVRTSRIVVK